MVAMKRWMLVWLALGGAAHADQATTTASAPPSTATPPEVTAPRIASTGFFAEGGLGIVDFLPPRASRDAALGPAMELRIGRDLFSWLSIGGYVAASSHEATLPPPPEGQFFQLYRAGGDGRLGWRFGAIGVFVEGGFGISMISSNVLDKAMLTTPGKHYSATIHGGGGLEYQLENRHYGIGLAADAFLEPSFGNMKGIGGRLYLRYTYGGG